MFFRGDRERDYRRPWERWSQWHRDRRSGRDNRALVDDIDFPAVIEFGGKVPNSVADDFAERELFVAVGIGGFAFEDHFAAFEHGAFGKRERWSSVDSARSARAVR